MGRLFGTDGIRGVVGKDLSADTAFRLGRAVAELVKEGTARDVLIGRDTRLSGQMLASAVSAGLMAGGVNAIDLGILSTPAVAYLVKSMGAGAGVMISASHNSAQHNGLKVFGSDGFKLSDEDEDRLEDWMLDRMPMEYATHPNIGREKDGVSYAERYVAHVREILAKHAKGKREGKILFDLSCGSACATAKTIFTPDLLCGMTVDFCYDDGDGARINDRCGSTHIDRLANDVVHGGYDIGFAFDGDADRCLAVDEKGNILDGDILIAHLAKDGVRSGRYDKTLAVVTVMTNLAFHRFCNKEGIEVAVTSVGDKYVLREMLRLRATIGGEQSGHIIFPEYATTGDGQVTAAVSLGLLLSSGGKRASEVFGEMKPLPQITKNVTIGRDDRERVMESPVLCEKIDEVKKLLDQNGRVLIRPSGTESLIRIMLEGEDQNEINRIAGEIAETIEKICGVQ